MPAASRGGAGAHGTAVVKGIFVKDRIRFVAPPVPTAAWTVGKDSFSIFKSQEKD